MDDAITRQQIVELLNELLTADEDAITRIVYHEVPCNQHVANHPTVMVGPNDDGEDGKPATLRLVGVLNGLIRKGPRIGFEFDDETERIRCFKLIEPHRVGLPE